MKELKSYKVLEDYEMLTKDLVLNENGDGAYTAETSEKTNGITYVMKIKVDQNYMDSMIANDIVVQVDRFGTPITNTVNSLFESVTKAEENTKWLTKSFNDLNIKYQDYVKFLYKMKEAYEQDRLDAIETYTDGNLAVNEYKQAVTVFDNLLKFINVSLNKLK